MKTCEDFINSIETFADNYWRQTKGMDPVPNPISVSIAKPATIAEQIYNAITSNPSFKDFNMLASVYPNFKSNTINTIQQEINKQMKVVKEVSKLNFDKILIKIFEDLNNGLLFK